MREEEKRVSEVETAGWHQQCNEHELGQTLGDGEGQVGLGCCSPWGCKESDMTGQPNNNNNNIEKEKQELVYGILEAAKSRICRVGQQPGTHRRVAVPI